MRVALGSPAPRPPPVAAPSRGRGRPPRATAAPASPDPGPPVELRVCTNKTCRRQGSQQIAKLARDFGMPGLAVADAGCLGVCGAGPNVALLPAGVTLSHVATAARLAQVLTAAGLAVTPALLAATEARLAGNAAARRSDFAAAEAHYTRGLAAGEPRAAHLLLSNRAGVRLSAGDAEGAAADADAAVAAAPPDFIAARVRQVEARAALGDAGRAADALAAAVATDPTFAASPEAAALGSLVAGLAEPEPACGVVVGCGNGREGQA